MKRINFITYVVLSVFQCSVALRETPVIQTKLGPVKGEIKEVAGVEVYHFGSIPYAEPMIGNLRYKKTVPKKPWTDVLNVGPDAIECWQRGHGDEDCLKIAVWVKKSVFEDAVNNKKLASVFSYIHGGGFRGGSLHWDNMIYMAANNDLVATVLQYRLGSLGFAYLGTEDVPGNMGLWDQLEAMKWVRDNIEAFGGNKKEITIDGSSAGGVSVTLHMMSPHSRGKDLYRSAIAQSGSALCVWASHSKDASLKATNVVFDANCPHTATMEEKLKCLRAIDPYNVTLYDPIVADLTYAGLTFGPVVDGDFLPRDPVAMLKDNEFEKVPFMFSSLPDEGSRFTNLSPLAGQYLPDKDHPDRLEYHTYKEYELFIDERFRLLTESPLPLLLETIKLQYWPRNHEGYPKGREVFDAVQHAEGDYAFTCPTFHFGKAMSKHVDNVFAFLYSHRLKNHSAPEWMGVMHGDEMAMTSGYPFNPANTRYTPDEKELSRNIMAYFANFVKYNNPNGKDADSSTLRYWPPFVGSSNCTEQYFEINAKTIVTGVATTDATICGLKARECLFWQDLVPKEIEALAENDESRTTAKPGNLASSRQKLQNLVFLIISALAVDASLF